MDGYDNDGGRDGDVQAPGTTASPLPSDPDQEHPPQEAHGGSMAPGLVDDTGHPIADVPDAEADRPTA